MVASLLLALAWLFSRFRFALARVRLGFLVLAIAVLPGVACGTSNPYCDPGPLNVPACSTLPGQAVPPALIKPLSWPDQPPIFGPAVGTLAGAGQVTATGEYRYRLPLDVPAGRAGMQPRLGLVFSSRGKSGHAGLGWALEGFSAIERCPKTLATEGLVSGIHVDAKDAFCLDGHKLIALQGAYGGNGTEYRTEDDIFAKIVSSAAAPTSSDAPGEVTGFQVWTKEGTLQTYTPVEIPKTTAYDHANLAWLLAEEADRTGNAVRYSYTTRIAHDASTPVVEYYPKRIDYTLQTQKNPVEPGQRSVEFSYEDRPDKTFAMVGNVRVETTMRLHEVRAYAPNPTLPWLVGSTLLSYDQSSGSGVSRLTRVERCGALGSCLQAKQFTWASTTGMTYASASYPGMGIEERPIVTDLDGDGKDEVVLLWNKKVYLRTTVDPAHPLAVEKEADGFFFDHLVFSEARSVDLNGDGRGEIIAPNHVVHNYQVLGLSSPLTDAKPLLWSFPIFGEPYDEVNNSPLHVIDLDGDGRPDLIKGDRLAGINNWAWSYRLNIGSLLSFAPKVAVSHLSAPPIRALDDRNIAFAFDDGEHRGTLLVARHPKPLVGQRHQFEGFSVDATGARGATMPTNPGALTAFADLNGDGLREHVSWSNEPSSSRLCAESVGWPSKIGCLDIDLHGVDTVGLRLQVADLDADGKDELLLIHPSQKPDEQKVFLVRLSVNQKLEQLSPAMAIPDAIGDFDGDGLLDLADRDATGWNIHRQTGSGTADRLIAVLDEGNPTPREEVDYSLAWSPAPDPANCMYPQRCMRHGFSVVREHRRDPGEDVAASGAATRVERQLYTYEDPRFDVRGRGFLGFGTVREWDPRRSGETITTYDNVTVDAGIYPYALRPKTVQRAVVIEAKDGKRARIAKISLEDKLEHLNQNKTYFVHPSAWTSLEWEEDVTVNPDEAAKIHITQIDGVNPELALRERHGSATYDAYGNELTATASTVHGVSTEVLSTYEIRVADWLVGLHKTEQVTATDAGLIPPPAPRHVDYEYDKRGLLCHVFIEKNDPDPAIPEVITFAHDDEGLVLAITNSTAGEPSRTTHFAYDPAERVYRSAQWNDLGQAQWFIVHPAFGAVVASEDENGVRTYAHVDDLGRLRGVQPEGQGGVTLKYASRVAPSGHLVGMSITTSEDAGGVTRADLDVLGRSVGGGHVGFDGTWIEQRVSYDALGRVVEVSRPGVGAPAKASTRRVYDNLDRQRAEVSPDIKTTVFDQTFFTTKVTDPIGHARTVVRDVDDRIVKSIEQADGPPIVTTFHHDAFHQVDQITDAKNNTIEVHYDHRGRRASVHDPDAGPTALYYNGFGDLKTTVRGALVTQNKYDLLGRPTQVEDADGTATYVWDASPNGVGKLSHTQSADGTTQDFLYDALARPKTQTWTVQGKAFAFERTYDPMGRPETLAYPEVINHPRFTVWQTYTASNYAKGVSDATSFESFWQAEIRNSDDQLVQAALGNGLMAQRGYDSTTGRLTSVTEGAALAVAYDYDSDGQVWHRDDALANRLETFSYDGLHRLERWTLAAHIPVPAGFPKATKTIRETSYHYDELGNVIQAAVKGIPGQDSVYGANGKPHALSSNAQGIFFHDDRGRQTVAPGRTVDFTEFDLPKTITTPSGVTHFLYDAGHGRVKKDGPTGSVVSLGGLYERRESGGKIQHVFYVQGEDGTVAQVVVDEGAPGSVTTYLHRDPLGSVGAVTDKAGVVQQTLFYEPFGARRDVDGGPVSLPAADVPVGFTGQRHDDELGLIDFHGRVYDPAIRRFLTPDPHMTDPLGGQSYNRYTYANNDPTNLIDPSGFDWWGGSASGGCIGLECYGGGGWDGTFGAPGDWIEQGVHWITPGSGGSGTSTPRYPSGGAVFASEDRRPVSLPTGPSAPAAAVTGPAPQAWADAAGDGGEPKPSWKDHGAVQFVGGLLSGVGLGILPGGAVADQLLTKGKVLDKGTRPAQFGKAVGEMVGGFFTTAFGMTGEVVGSGLTVTGIGALLGVPAIAVSATLVTAGAGNMAAGLAGFAQAMSTGSGGGGEVRLPSSKYPETAAHVQEAQAAGHPSELTIDRPRAPARRSESMASHENVSGMDRDEYPPAMFKEGGRGASVRPVTPRDNRGAGACIGNQCRGLPNGTKVKIVVE